MTEGEERIWYTFSLAEEYGNSLRDKYGRFPRYASARSDVMEPGVSAWLLRNGLCPKYPGDRKFALCLSHDVDFLFMNKSAYLKAVMTGKALLRGQLSSAISGMSQDRMLDPRYSLENTLRIEKRFEATSSFYFLALGEEEKDYNYRVTDIKDQFASVLESGCEIGLHGGHGAAEREEILLAHKKRLEQAAGKPVTGYRSHYLRMDVPQTWNLLMKNGFSHDTTLGYSDSTGFRNGMCHPFYPYDRGKKQFLDIVELPLAIMDVTLFNHMNLDSSQAKQLCTRLLARVAELNGVLCFLWHNNNMQGAMGDFYSWFLQEAFDRGGWLTHSTLH